MAAALQQPSDIPVSLASERAVLGEGWGSDDGDCEAMTVFMMDLHMAIGRFLPTIK
jgi:hypothetical protein